MRNSYMIEAEFLHTGGEAIKEAQA